TVSFGSRAATTGGTGSYTFPGLPVGTYANVTVTYPGYNTAIASNVLITNGGTTIQNFSLDAARVSDCLIDASQAAFQNSDRTNLDITTNPGHVVLTKPDVLDQQNTNVTNSGFGFNATNWAGQTFKAAISGPITRVDLDLFCSSCTGTTPNISVSIRATAGTPALPTGAD